MKIFITTSICFLLLLSFQSSIAGSLVKITGLKTENGVWDPGLLNRSELEKAIKLFFVQHTEKIITVDPEYILNNLSDYTIEYAGIISDNGKKIVQCRMILDYNSWHPDVKAISEKSRFTTIFDGGCSIVDLGYNPENSEIIFIICNGVA